MQSCVSHAFMLHWYWLDLLWPGRVHGRCWWGGNPAAAGRCEDLRFNRNCPLLPGLHQRTLRESARDSPERDHSVLPPFSLWYSRHSALLNSQCLKFTFIYLAHAFIQRNLQLRNKTYRNPNWHLFPLNLINAPCIEKI